MSNKKSALSSIQKEELIKRLQTRFMKNMHRHKDFDWQTIQSRLEQDPEKLWSLNAMEETGGEPDVIAREKKTDEYVFCDCSAESPKGRRSLCYDPEALSSRKEHKPKHSAVGMAKEMGVDILSEAQYRELQRYEKFDTKTSSWIATPKDIRDLGGALFCDWRYGCVFVYHNGAESYYASRGFRASIRV